MPQNEYIERFTKQYVHARYSYPCPALALAHRQYRGCTTWQKNHLANSPILGTESASITMSGNASGRLVRATMRPRRPRTSVD